MSVSSSNLSSPEALEDTALNSIRRVGHYMYREKDRIGSGAYGAVYLAYDTTRCSVEDAYYGTVSAEVLRKAAVALKIMTPPKMEDGVSAATLREVMTFKEIAHRLRSDERSDCVIHRSRPYSCAFRYSGLRSFGGDSLVQSPSNSSPVPLDDNSSKQDLERDGDSVYVGAPVLSTPSLSSLDATIAEGRQHLLQMYEVIADPRTASLHFALELCDHGDLWHYLRHQKGRQIRDPRLYRMWMKQMMQAIAFLHSRNISHRDLKPQNIMLMSVPHHSKMAHHLRGYESGKQENLSSSSSSGSASMSASEGEEKENPFDIEVKVGDFGLCRIEDIAVKKYVHEAVTLWYRSPDVILGSTHFCYTADAWSVACILVELAAGLAVARGRNEEDQLSRIFTNICGFTVDWFPNFATYPHSARYRDILEKMSKQEIIRWANPHMLARRAEERLRMKERYTSVTRQNTESIQEEIVSIKVLLREFLTINGDGFAVLGEDGLDMVARLFVLDPNIRLTVAEALMHPFFNEEAQRGDTQVESAAEVCSLPSDDARSLIGADIPPSLLQVIPEEGNINAYRKADSVGDHRNHHSHGARSGDFEANGNHANVNDNNENNGGMLQNLKGLYVPANVSQEQMRRLGVQSIHAEERRNSDNATVNEMDKVLFRAVSCVGSKDFSVLQSNDLNSP